MKIIVSEQSPDKGGDIITLARLLSILELQRDFHYPEDLGQQITLDLWIEYLESIANHLLAADMGRVAEKLEFDLPFEVDFTERLLKE